MGMNDMVELRCKYCGAPLDREEIESDTPYVTCQSCGTTQQRLDAKKYMDQMMGQIQSWIAKTIPGGFSMNQSENVDPVARHSIFINSVRPHIEVEITQYRFALNDAISNPLIVLPFTKGEPAKSKHTSTEAFEFDAKLKSVAPLAVDDDSRKCISTGESIAHTYALIVNNSRLLTDTTPGRFALMSKNFRDSAELVSRCQGYEMLSSRLVALSDVCSASDMILNGDVTGCLMMAEKATKELEDAKKDLLTNPRLAMTLRAVDLEIGQCRTLKSVADMVHNGTSRDPLKLLNIINELSVTTYPSNGQWDRLLTRDERNYELYGYVNDIVTAKGGGTLPICSGGGTILFPFWDVDLKYSFTTGGLFSKKSVVVTEDLMVPATFTVSASALSNPRLGLTDIFAAAPESSILTRWKGEEQSISGSAGIGKLADSVADNPPGTRSVIVPLCTKMEATRLVELYLTQCASTHSKLKLSKPEVKRLVYIPCSVTDRGIGLPDEFSGLAPRILSDTNADGLLKL